MAKEKKYSFATKRPDRVLGDHWSDWTGSMDEMGSRASSLLFFFFAALALFLLVVLVFFTLYMISPRLSGYHPALPHLFFVLALIITSFLVLWFFVVVGAAWSGRRLMPGRRISFLLMRYLLDKGHGLAGFCGVHRDRYGHSFIRFSNRLARAYHQAAPIRLLVLLPRCLRPELRLEVEELGRRRSFDVYVAAGGGSARQIITELRPQAIVAVACERDLVAGIREVAPHLPVLAVPNERPAGPCKSTGVDMGLLRSYIDFFLRGAVSSKV